MKKTLFCVGLGAGLMYLFDPQHGEERRSGLFDKVSGRMPQTADAISNKAEVLTTKAHDLSVQADAKAAEVISTVGPQPEAGSETPSADSNEKPKD